MSAARYADPGRLAIRIGTLVLDGVPGIDRPAFEAALRKELERLFTRPGEDLAAGIDGARHLQAGPIGIAERGDAAGLARELARSIHGRLTASAGPAAGPHPEPGARGAPPAAPGVRR
jgi:hypothetical protein